MFIPFPCCASFLQAVYDKIAGTPEPPLIDRFRRYYSAGLMFGWICCAIVSILYIINVFLEWLVPAATIEVSSMEEGSWHQQPHHPLALCTCPLPLAPCRGARTFHTKPTPPIVIDCTKSTPHCTTHGGARAAMGVPPHLDVLGVVDHDEGVVAATLLERGLELQERELLLLGDSTSRLPLAMLEQVYQVVEVHQHPKRSSAHQLRTKEVSSVLDFNTLYNSNCSELASVTETPLYT